MFDIKVSVKGTRPMLADLEAASRAEQQALKTAIKIEGFRQLKLLREEIRAGAPGGRPYPDELSRLARRTKRGALRKNQMPLYRLARLLRYNIEYERGGNIRMSFGFVNTNKQSIGGGWKKLLIAHQEGADVLYTKSRTELGRRFARIGGRLKKAGDPDAKYFFLKRSTGRKIDLPTRPMIDPFWGAYQQAAWKNIRENFRRKLRGERV